VSVARGEAVGLREDGHEGGRRGGEQVKMLPLP
jgi:hypothetical protein